MSFCIGLVLASGTALAVQSVPLAWIASSDPNVVGYRIYYGTTSQYYTNFVTVGNVTNTVINGLADNTTYFFSAKSYDSAGDESDYSNEASISSATVNADGVVLASSGLLDNSSGRYSFSLASGAPAGVSIDPATGYISWVPGRANASTTNYVKVVVTDSQNPNTSMVQTLVIVVGDFLNVALKNAVVQAGQNASLPIEVFASAGMTNLSFAVTWTGHHFSYASLQLNNQTMTGTIQATGSNLVIQIANMQIAPGSNYLGQLTLLATAGQNSSVVPVRVLSPSAIKADASVYTASASEPGQVTIIGAQPLISAPATASTGGRALTVYGNPQSNYQVQYTTNLAAAAWQPLVNFTQTNLVQTVVLPDTRPVAFYRLAQQ